MSDTSGPTLREPLAIYDPATSCWRMFGGMFPSDSMPSLATFPAWGMTRAGELFELPTPAPPTGGPGFSSLLPTPVSDNSRGLPSKGTDYASLPNVAVSLLPTPRAQNGEPRNQNVWARPLDQPQNLENALALLPTPAVNDMGAGKTVEQWDEWTAKMRAKHGNGNGHGASLSIEAARLLPTPTAHPENAASAEWGYPTLLDAARSIGASTPPPSPAGNTSSDDPRQPRLSLDETAAPD